jgi:release factor glutamine methyltransferase
MKLQELLQDPAYKQKFVLEKLIQEYLGFSREAMWIGLEQEIPADKLETIQNAYKSCVEDKKPLEYVVGHVNFFGVPFYVNENTIIPRPETEYMISAVSEYIASFRTVPRPVVLRDGEEGSDLSLAAGKQGDFQNHILLDIGTGSGVLGISILFHNPNFYRSIFLCDISPEALIVAKKNYDTLIRSTYYDTRFVQSDLAAFVESYPDIMQS